MIAAGEHVSPAFPPFAYILCLFERGFLDGLENLAVQEYVQSLDFERYRVFLRDIEELDQSTVAVCLQFLLEDGAHHDGAAAVDADNIDFIVGLLDDLLGLVQDFLGLNLQRRGDVLERDVVVFVALVFEDIGVFLPRELHEAEMILEIVNHGIDGVAVAVVRAADEVRLEMDVLRDREFRRALADGDMQHAERGEILFMELRVRMLPVVLAIHVILVLERERGRDAFRDDFDKVIGDIDHDFLAADVDADMVLLAGEFRREVVGVLLAVVGDRQGRRHIGMHGNRLVEVLPVLGSGLLDGCCCRMGERVDVDNIARQLVVVDAYLDGVARNTGIEGALSDVVQAAFNGDEKLIMDVLQDAFRGNLVQIRQPHGLCEYVRLLNQLVVDDEILLAVPVVVCNFQIHI